MLASLDATRKPCLKQGKHVAAAPLCQRALEIDEKVYGPNHIEVAADLTNRAWLLYRQVGEGRLV